MSNIHRLQNCASVVRYDSEADEYSKLLRFFSYLNRSFFLVFFFFFSELDRFVYLPSLLYVCVQMLCVCNEILCLQSCDKKERCLRLFHQSYSLDRSRTSFAVFHRDLRLV